MDSILNGTSETDLLIGTPDDDTILGLAGDDFIQGEAGSDLIQGGVGSDIIEAGEGDDTIEGGLVLLGAADPDDDTIFGNGGIDTVAFTGAFADFTITTAAVFLPDSAVAQPGFEVADTRSPATVETNGTDLVADDVEFLAFAPEGSILSLADFDPDIPLQAPVLTAIATTDTAALPADSPTNFVAAIPVEVAADGTAVAPVVISPEDLAVTPATVDGVEAEIAFAIEVLPMVGTLLLNGEVLAVGDTFAPADLAAGALSFDIPEVVTFAASDLSPSFEFSVTSGPFTLEEFPALPGEDGAIANANAGAPLTLSFDLFGEGVPSVDLDVDGSGAVEPSIDVLNIFRVLAGAPQAVVVPEGLDISQQAVVDAVEAFPEIALDVDESGAVESSIDVLNIFRVLAGAPQAVVIPEGLDTSQQAVVDAVNGLVA